MIVRIHGFDWYIYAQQVMPAFYHWLLERDEKLIYQLYQQTRCAQEEQSVPSPLQALRTWPRAQTYVQQLPQSTHAHREYEHLCSPERFTATSDRYVYRHPPQLLQSSEALRTVWGSLIETYCLPWLSLFKKGPAVHEPTQTRQNQLDQELMRLLRLRETSGLKEEFVEQEAEISDIPQNDPATSVEPTGVIIGRLPTTLHLRGWLATIAVRAMALFELLACERRCMPFGYQPGTPFASYAGYLTPYEVQQLALCLRDIEPPNQAVAVMDYQRFRQQVGNRTAFRMIDEVLPLHAHTFLSTLQLAVQQGIGLICSIG